MLACGLILLGALPIRATDWPSWRGGRLEGRLDARGPLGWSPTSHMRWRTPVAGDGYSSPITSGTMVFLTTAIEIPENRPLLATLRIAHLAALALLWLLIVTVAVRQTRDRWSGFLPPAALPFAGMLLLSLLMFFAEPVFDFNRAPERAWAASALVLTCCLCLGAWSLGSGHRARRAGSFSLLLGTAIVAWIIPDLPHTVLLHPGSAASLFLYAVVAVPLLTGLALLPDPGTATGTTTHRPRLQPVAGLLAAVLLPGAIVVAAIHYRAPLATISLAHPYVSLLQWWMVAPVAALWLLLLLLRRASRGASWLAIAEAAALAVLLLTLPFAVCESVLARNLYLAHLLGTPRATPVLGWWSLLSLGGVPAAVAAHLLFRKAGACPLRWMRAVSAGAALCLASSYVLYANFVPRSPHLNRYVLAFDAATGARRWTSAGLPGERGEMHSDNSPATPTPVTDGWRVFAYFGTPGILCTDLSGRTRWTNAQFPYESREGVASSPILCGERLILLSESDAGCFLAALDTGSGRQLWRTNRQKKVHSYAGNCRTPSLLDAGGRLEIIVWGIADISGYAPETGRESWSYPVGDFGVGGNPVASAVTDGRRLYLAGPYRTVCLDVASLRAGTPPVVWDRPADDGAQCASPVLHGDLLTAVSDNGTVYCLDARTGTPVWTRKLGRQHYASILCLQGRLYLTGTDGLTTILAADRANRLLGVGELPGRIFATPAPVDGGMLIRTHHDLYRIEEAR